MKTQISQQHRSAVVVQPQINLQKEDGRKRQKIARFIHLAVALLIAGFTMGWTQLAFAQASTTADVVYGQQGSFTASGTKRPQRRQRQQRQWFPTSCLRQQWQCLRSRHRKQPDTVFLPGQYHRHAGLRAAGQLHFKHAEQRRDQRRQLTMAPYDLALDRSGNLYVADSYNNRVLFYPAGSTTATRVYGQLGSFTTNT